RLREQNIVLLTKLDTASRPAIGFVIKTIMLITAGHISVDLRDHRRSKRADARALRYRSNQLHGTQEQLDRLLVTPGEMMKARLGGKRVCCFKWVRDRIEHLQSFAQVFVPARIVGGDERSRSLALQTHARRRFGRQSQRAFEV